MINVLTSDFKTRCHCNALAKKRSLRYQSSSIMALVTRQSVTDWVSPYLNIQMFVSERRSLQQVNLAKWWVERTFQPCYLIHLFTGLAIIFKLQWCSIFKRALERVWTPLNWTLTFPFVTWVQVLQFHFGAIWGLARSGRLCTMCSNLKCSWVKNHSLYFSLRAPTTLLGLKCP